MKKRVRKKSRGQADAWKNWQKSAGRSRKKNRSKKKKRTIGICCLIAVLLLVFLVFVLPAIRRKSISGTDVSSADDGRPEIDVQLLTPNRYSRPQIQLNQINGIVIHYTANPGTTAQENRDYFEGLKDSHETHASSHFIIGLDGEIIQCIPSSEICYAANKRNYDTLSIECCHPDSSGKFNDETYQSLVNLTSWLCRHFDVSADNIIRHYDITGKDCPKYFVEHEDAWEQFLADVKEKIAEDQEQYG
ncbi:MAG: N-acetylmuramoyl-L-alanine amidase family protein [Bilifractor sp.]|jgi:N-acetylmuramoyl-L-alanine amidase